MNPYERGRELRQFDTGTGIKVVPTPKLASHSYARIPSTSDYQNLLVSIESSKRSCCLQIESETNKSRSAILVFRGRILGCIYGKQGLQQHLFNEAAYCPALKDLSSPNHTVTMYELHEALVIAAAALFHGVTVESSEDADATHIFDHAHDTLIHLRMPGSISIVGKHDLSVCMVYIFGGRVVGVYSDQAGWMEPTYAAVRNHLNEIRSVLIHACMLPAKTTDEVTQLTFDISDIPDHDKTSLVNEIQKEVTYPVSSPCRLRPIDLPAMRRFSVIEGDKFVPRRWRGASARHSAEFNNTFAVHP